MFPGRVLHRWHNLDLRHPQGLTARLVSYCETRQMRRLEPQIDWPDNPRDGGWSQETLDGDSLASLILNLLWYFELLCNFQFDKKRESFSSKNGNPKIVYMRRNEAVLWWGSLDLRTTVWRENTMRSQVNLNPSVLYSSLLGWLLNGQPYRSRQTVILKKTFFMLHRATPTFLAVLQPSLLFSQACVLMWKSISL